MSRHRRQQRKRSRRCPRDNGFCPDWCFALGFAYVPAQYELMPNGTKRKLRTKPIWVKQV